MRKISANYVFPVAGKPIAGGVITLNDEGVITAISDRADAGDTVEFYDGALVPGFVNTHCHLELSYMKGVLPRHAGLAGFVKRIMETKFDFPEDVQRKAIADADRAMWESGVQAVGDISNTTVSFDTKRSSRVKYVTFIEIFDVLFGVDYKVIVAEAAELAQAAKNYGIEAYVSPHSTYAVSGKLYEAYARMADTQCLSVHYRESIDDDLLFSKKGEFWKLFNEKGLAVDFLEDGSSTARILKYIDPSKRMLLVHNTNITQSDIDALKARYSKISLALCPQSNQFIEQMLPPVALLKNSGLNLSIGTDSLSSNDELNMVGEMRVLSKNAGLGFEEVLSWATLGGARALGLDNVMGSLEVGKKPGVVLVEALRDDVFFTSETRSKRLI